MRRLRRIALWCLAVLMGVPAFLLVIVLVGVNTHLGQHEIEKRLPSLTGGMIEVRGLSGILPWHLALDHAEVRDQKGAWLELDHADLMVSLSALLGKTIHIDHVRAGSLVVHRKPLPSPAPAPTKKTQTSLPSLAVTLDELTVDRLDVGHDVVGHAVTMHIEGKASLGNIAPLVQKITLDSLPDTQVHLDIRRLDQPAHIALTAQNRSKHLDLSFLFDEEKKGFITTMGHMPSLDPAHLTLDLHGPYHQLATALSIQAGEQATGIIHGDVKGVMNARDLLGDLEVHLHAPSMTLSPTIGWESVALDTQLHGHLVSPQGAGTLDVKGLAASGSGAENIHLQFTGEGEGPAALPTHVRLKTRIDGLRIPGKDPTLFAASPLTLQAEMKPSDEGRPFTVALDHEVVHATLAGKLTPALSGHAVVTIPEFARLAGAMGTRLQGHTTLMSDFALPATAHDPLTASLKGDIAFLGGQAQAVNLIGQQGHLETHVTRLPNGAVQLERVMLHGRALHLSGQGMLDDQKHLRADLSLALPDLQQADSHVRGKADLGLTVAGALDDLETTLHLNSQFGAQQGKTVIPTAPIALTVHAVHVPKHPEADLTLTGMLDRAPIDIKAHIVRDIAGNMGLELANVSWKTLKGKGVLSLPAGQKIPKGDLDLAITRLEVFRNLIGQPISGHLTLAAHTASAPHDKTGPSSEQDTLQLGMDAHVAMAEYAVRQFTLKGAVSHLPAAPYADLTMHVDGVKAKNVTGGLQAQIKGPQNALALSLKGRFDHVLEAPAALEMSAVEDVPGKAVQLNKLIADVKGEHVQLMAPSKLNYGAVMGVDRLKITVKAPHGPPASFSAAGKIKPELALTFALDQVTPSLAEPFAPNVKADGVISASGTLHGTLAAPLGTITLNGSGLHMRTEPAASLPAAGFQVKTLLQGKTAQLQAHLDAGRGVLFALQGTAPLQPTGPLNVNAKGKIDLSVANAILGASGMGVGGNVSLDMGVRGTLKQPALSGAVQLRQGSFDHYAQGVHLTGMTGDITAHDDSLSIDQLVIHAGEGTMALTGKVGVLRPGLPVDVNFIMDKAQPLRNDMLEETINSQLHIFGQASTRLDVAGWVKIPQASITIPDSMPASVPQLEIVTPQKDAERAASHPLVIGLNIDVNSPGQLFVRGHGLFAEMQGKLHVDGTSKAPVISGGIDLRRGSFNLAGINLNFSQGRVGFDGAGVSHKIDPTIDFRADRNSNGTLASLTVSGHASGPKLGFSSSPRLPQDEVLAILLFGVNRASLSATQLAELAAAVAQLGGGSAFDPLGKARSALGLDHLAIGGGSSVGNGGTNVEAGKYVMKGVYVGAREGLSGKSTQAQVRVDLTKHLKLNTTVGTGGQVTGFTTPENDPGSSVGLSYGIDY